MFKLGSFEKELASSMETSLISNRMENKFSFDKIAKVADYLSAAAELLDDTGHLVEADMVTKILAKLAGEESADENDSKTRFETPEGLLSMEEMKARNPAEVADPDADLIEALEDLDEHPLEQELFVEPKTLASKEYLGFKLIASSLNNKLAKKKA